jgi:predicted O-methyltransferase YrrM
VTVHGTAAYDGVNGLPPLVHAAVEAARRTGFAYSCLPQQGALLRVLAGGVPDGGLIGETGTGCGVGLGWLASGAGPGTRLVSVERDAALAETARAAFAADGRVRVHTGDWTALEPDGPFDLLVLDGGGQGKDGGRPVDPRRWLRPGGLVVVDDFSPARGWPPTHDGAPDTARLYWLCHPDLLAAEIRVTPAMSTVVATYPGTTPARR